MKTFDSDVGHRPEVDPQSIVADDERPITGTNEQQILDFIDAWLADNAWTADSRVIDFALDIRNMLAEIEESLPEPVGAGV